MTITDIIRNEIEFDMGHAPNIDEQSVYITYIKDAIADKINANEKVWLSDIELAITQCSKERFVKCEYCGKLFFREDLNEHTGMCEECHIDYCNELRR